MNKTTKTTKTEPRYMKTAEAIDYLGVSKQTLMRLVNRGELEISRIGKRIILFRKSELDAIFERNAETRGAG